MPVVRDGRMHLAPVTLGYDNGINVEVTQGIGDDDVVAVNVGQSAREGEVVQAVMQEQHAGSGGLAAISSEAAGRKPSAAFANRRRRVRWPRSGR